MKDNGGKKLDEFRKASAEHLLEKTGEEVRALYSWNNESEKLINN